MREPKPAPIAVLVVPSMWHLSPWLSTGTYRGHSRTGTPRLGIYHRKLSLGFIVISGAIYSAFLLHPFSALAMWLPYNLHVNLAPFNLWIGGKSITVFCQFCFLFYIFNPTLFLFLLFLIHLGQAERYLRKWNRNIFWPISMAGIIIRPWEKAQ